MSDQNFHPSNYSKLRSTYKYYIDIYNALYQLKKEKEEELNSIYKIIKIELIDSNKYPPQNMIKDILNIIPYNNRFAKSYLTLAKLISDEYHVKEVNSVRNVSKFLFYKEYGIKSDKSDDFQKDYFNNLEIHIDDTIYKAIMNNDLERFIAFTEREWFDKNQSVKSSLYPYSDEGYSLLELCCYHGAVDCFKFLRTKFNSEITQKCLRFSFLGGNPEIMSECLKHQEPDKECMEYAIISHNIDFITFLMNEYNIEIDLKYCGAYNNLESFLVCFDQTDDFIKFFVYSPMFNIPSLFEYFLSHGVNVNEKYKDGETALHIAAWNNSKETVEFLISYGANINEKDKDGRTTLHITAWNNSKEIAEVLISHGANINQKDKDRETALHIAASHNSKETTEVLISHGANINQKNKDGETALYNAAWNNSKEIAEVLISHGANINQKDKDRETALHIAATHNSKETVEFLISHGANINVKIKKEKPHSILQHGIIVKKLPKCLFHMVRMSMKKINMEELHFMLQHGITVKKLLNFLFHTMQISMKRIKKEKLHFMLQHGIIVKKLPKCLFHTVQISM
ncbi:hypothetical protein TVAG_321050 [Trichomonas vaginalis G3]|uniref:DUF3447 domain-containing protein n=1 Tax=Trichomonas vaginalis (strain ATCC PRA-98 / G3) TaxID=412133 RepID=A2F813_TRIV3|nr:ankyrin repeat and SOCS box-containing protein 4 family [Trichomonas vaginalis G3]EAX98945.1 hypothetical protein TVAG_321050 [Trichomonas vaginalis G3]KAI5533489.1 ankyrin repeat and SOCS box-containing protein 4 family [Trichomonas vaginalis G3]|eukprot:XP_001311875.1 hypothetical protein [Trichomonas vaginalis G3]